MLYATPHRMPVEFEVVILLGGVASSGLNFVRRGGGGTKWYGISGVQYICMKKRRNPLRKRRRSSNNEDVEMWKGVKRSHP